MVNLLQVTVDSFKNLVANLNTTRDKQYGGDYALSTLTDSQLSIIYRTSWLAKKLVDIPAVDATRKWREWNAESAQIEDIEREEKRLKLPQRVKKALQQARLYGGSSIYFSIKGDDPALEIDLDRIAQGSLEFITVLSKRTLIPGDIDTDPMSQYYGKPKWYSVSSEMMGNVRIHPSRLVIFSGSELLDPEDSSTIYQGWGDSVLQAAYEAVRNADATASNVGSLVYEAKVDVLQIPNLANIMADPRQRALLEQRVILSATLKGNNGMLVIDGEEEYSQKSFNFAGLVDINHQSLQAVAGAGDIPMTRFLGQSPSGFQSTGEADLKNYYDAVAGVQNLIVTPALFNLDECVIRSALGNRPEDVYYQWASLWQMSDEQKSKISKETAETLKVLADSGLFPDEDLMNAAVNVLTEHSILPSLEITEIDFHDQEEEEPAAPVVNPEKGR